MIHRNESKKGINLVRIFIASLFFLLGIVFVFSFNSQTLYILAQAEAEVKPEKMKDIGQESIYASFADQFQKEFEERRYALDKSIGYILPFLGNVVLVDNDSEFTISDANNRDDNVTIKGALKCTPRESGGSVLLPAESKGVLLTNGDAKKISKLFYQFNCGIEPSSISNYPKNAKVLHLDIRARITVTIKWQLWSLLLTLIAFSIVVTLPAVVLLLHSFFSLVKFTRGENI